MKISHIGIQKDLSIFNGTMAEMTWQEVKKAAEEGSAVLLPIGVIEAHGPHMDLTPDVYLSCLPCRFLKKRLQEKGVPSIIAPPFYWGISADLKNYPGTFSVRPDTMKALLVDILASLDAWGFRHVFIVNAHGDHTHIEMIRAAIRETQDSLRVQAYFMWELDVPVENAPDYPEPREGRFEPDYHAGAIETACMHTFYPEKVNAECAMTLKPQDTFHPLGYCGDPASFPLEKDIMAFYDADVEIDAMKIEKILKGITD